MIYTYSRPKISKNIMSKVAEHNTISLFYPRGPQEFSSCQFEENPKRSPWIILMIQTFDPRNTQCSAARPLGYGGWKLCHPLTQEISRVWSTRFDQRFTEQQKIISNPKEGKMWGPLVMGWFITPSSYSYNSYKPKREIVALNQLKAIKRGPIL